jgi:hypothetical protein
MREAVAGILELAAAGAMAEAESSRKPAGALAMAPRPVGVRNPARATNADSCLGLC